MSDGSNSPGNSGAQLTGGIALGRAADVERPLRIGILVSGRGSNMQALVAACRQGHVAAQPVIVVSDRPGAPALEKALAEGIPVRCLDFHSYPSREAYERDLIDTLQAAEVELIVLAGYMRILSSEVIRAFPQRILNIHPSLLPSFPGLHPHEQALAHGVKLSGCTVHLVDEGVDQGPIIAQQAVPVLDDDTPETLSERILEVEHQLYPEAVRLMASGALRLFDRRVVRSVERRQ